MLVIPLLVALSRLVAGGVATVHRMSSLHPLVFSGPSGSGKSTLVQRLMKEYPSCFAFSVSRKSLFSYYVFFILMYIKWV